MNRTLIETTRSMLMNSTLPCSFWAESLSTATYLHNRSPANTVFWWDMVLLLRGKESTTHSKERYVTAEMSISISRSMDLKSLDLRRSLRIEWFWNILKSPLRGSSSLQLNCLQLNCLQLSRLHSS